MRVLALLLLALAALLWRSLRRVRVVDPVFTPAPDPGWYAPLWTPSTGGAWVSGPGVDLVPPLTFDGPSGPYARPEHADRLPQPKVADALGGFIFDPSERVV